MININKYEQTKLWQVSLAEFEAGGWGNVMGLTFRIPHTTYKRFSSTNTQQLTQQSSDVLEVVFNELCEFIISAAFNRWAILKRIGFEHFPPKTQQWLKIFIYQSLVFIINNGLINEVVNGQSIATGGFEISNQASNLVFGDDIFGSKARAAIENSEIKQYKILSQNVLFKRSNIGNIEIIGKIDLAKLPEFT